MRRRYLLLVTSLLLTGCDRDRPLKPAPARACANEWNQRAPASYRRQLDEVVSRGGGRWIRVERSVPRTGLARIGKCFVAQASKVRRNHVFIEDHRGRWRLEHPRFPSNRGGPMVLENLVQRAWGFANAWVGDQGQVTIAQRDLPPPR